MQDFLVADEQVRQEKRGITLQSLPHPWNEVDIFLKKYITCEGIYQTVYISLNSLYCLIYAIGIYSIFHFIYLKTYITWQDLQDQPDTHILPSPIMA